MAGQLSLPGSQAAGRTGPAVGSLPGEPSSPFASLACQCTHAAVKMASLTAVCLPDFCGAAQIRLIDPTNPKRAFVSRSWSVRAEQQTPPCFEHSSNEFHPSVAAPVAMELT